MPLPLIWVTMGVQGKEVINLKKDKHLKIRTSQEIIDQVNELVEHYKSISVGTVNKTNIIELAINELYKKIENGK